MLLRYKIWWLGTQDGLLLGVTGVNGDIPDPCGCSKCICYKWDTDLNMETLPTTICIQQPVKNFGKMQTAPPPPLCCLTGLWPANVPYFEYNHQITRLITLRKLGTTKIWYIPYSLIKIRCFRLTHGKDSISCWCSGGGGDMCRQTTISQCKSAKYCQLYLFYEVNPLLSTVLGIFCRGVQHTASPTFRPIIMVAAVL